MDEAPEEEDEEEDEEEEDEEATNTLQSTQRLHWTRELLKKVRVIALSTLRSAVQAHQSLFELEAEEKSGVPKQPRPVLDVHTLSRLA